MANTTTTADWDLIITADRGWFSIDLKALWDYRDLIFLFVRRDLVSQYKQTILGPLLFCPHSDSWHTDKHFHFWQGC